VVIARNRMIAGLPSVIFRRNGAASSGGAVYLGGRSGESTMIRGVTIEQATGRPEAFRLLEGTWRRSGQ
jgi:predicted outer membrane repeat protein